LPVIIFSHGLCGDPETYTVIRRAIASFGFVVVAPTHNDGSASVIRYMDGTHRAVEMLKDFPKRVELDWRREQVFHRRDEIATLLDYLVNEDEAVVDELFRNKNVNLDFERIGLMGHSFGAATSIVTASAFKQFKCVVDLDGWMLPVPEQVIKQGLDVPFLILMSEHFTYLHKDIMDPQLELFNRSQNPANMMGVLFGTKHTDFSDTPLYYSSQISKWGKKKLTQAMTPRTALNYTTELATWFLRKHLKHDEHALEEEEFLKSFIDPNIRLAKRGLAIKDLRKKVMCQCCNPKDVIQ